MEIRIRISWKYGSVFPESFCVVIEACVEAWENMSPTKIEIAFRLLKHVMKKIHEKGGSNNFKIPHAGVRKELKAEGYPDVD